MSHYIRGYCAEHGDFDIDADSPQDECGECTRAGKAPSQVRYRNMVKVCGLAREAAAIFEDDLRLGRGSSVRKDLAREIREAVALLEKS